MAHGSPKQRELVREAIEQGHTEPLRRDHGGHRATGALEYARGRAQAEAEMARAAVQALPASEHSEALLYLTTYSIARDR